MLDNPIHLPHAFARSHDSQVDRSPGKGRKSFFDCKPVVGVFKGGLYIHGIRLNVRNNLIIDFLIYFS